MNLHQWRYPMAAGALAALLSSATTRASIMGFGDFSQFTINQDDAGAAPTFPAPGSIQLVNGAGEARSIFANTPQGVAQFTASFTYQVLNAGQDEGAAFILQNDPRGASAVGPGNHGFNGITNSAEVTFNIGENQSGVFTDGVGYNGLRGFSLSPVNLASGDPINVQFSFSGSTMTESLQDTVTSASFSNSFTLPVPSIVGGDSAYVGITAGSGADSVNQIFSNFQYTSTSPVPEPASVGLFMAGAALCMRRRRLA